MIEPGMLLADRRVDHPRLQLVGRVHRQFRCLIRLYLLLGPAVLGHRHEGGDVILQVPL